MGLDPPTSGQISVNGRVLDQGRLSAGERRRRSREIQMVFQDTYSSMNPRFSVNKTLRQAIKLSGASQASSGDVVRLLELVELSASLAGARPRTLSGGQRQRVAIARALASNAQILVLDEAVAALDVSIQAQILNLLSDLRETRHLTLIFISHDLAAVRQIADEVIVIHKGKVVERGTTDDVLTSPTSDYTRRLLDAVPRPGWIPGRTVPSSGESAACTVTPSTLGVRSHD
jgi:ABC-type glutathione transport system ATPase component